MRIGIIGAGYVGRAVAGLAMANGHEAMVSNSRAPDTLRSTCAALKCRAGTVEEAVRFGEIVVLAVPFRRFQALPAPLLAGKMVIDTLNYYPDRDGPIAELDSGSTTTSELVARHLAGARLVKMFNAIMAVDLERDGRVAGAPDRRALPMAGDDAEAKAAVSGLVEQFGYDVVDCGALAEGWRFERARPVYCVPMGRDTLAKTLAATQRTSFVAEGSWRNRPAGLQA